MSGGYPDYVGNDAWLRAELQRLQREIEDVRVLAQRAAPGSLVAVVEDLAAVAASGNRVINGDFRVNQRSAVSGTSLSSGTYFLDRWKSGTGSNPVTWTGDGIAGRVLTIGSGERVDQQIERANMPAGRYILAWDGTAQGRMHMDGAGPSFAASPVIADLDGTADVDIAFQNGTLSNVRVYPGEVDLGYHARPIGLELLLCQRYFWRRARNAEGDIIGTASIFGGTPSLHYLDMTYPVEMRAAPTFAVANVGSFRAHQNGIAISNCTAIAAINLSKNSAQIRFTAGGGYVNGGASMIEGSGVPGGTLDFTAEL